MSKPTCNQWHIKMADSQMERMPLLDKRWSYDYGVVWNGFVALYEITGEQKYFDYIKNGIDSFVAEDGSIRDYTYTDFNLDYVNNGKLCLYLLDKTGEQKYRLAADMLFDQLKHQPRTPEGGYWHKKIYPEQMWLDGIYMAEPFYARYAVLNNLPEKLHDVAQQIILCYEHTFDPATGLNRHAWDAARVQPWADKQTGLSQHAWGRAMGWYMAALADVLDYFPEGQSDLPRLKQIYLSVATSLQSIQDEKTGVWYQVLDCPHRAGNYLESSCSALITYSLAKGARKGYLPASFMDSARRAYAGIIEQFIEVYKDQAIINKACQVAGLGGNNGRDGSFEYYMSEPIIMNDLKAIGAFIQAAAEIEGR